MKARSNKSQFFNVSSLMTMLLFVSELLMVKTMDQASDAHSAVIIDVTSPCQGYSAATKQYSEYSAREAHALTVGVAFIITLMATFAVPNIEKYLRHRRMTNKRLQEIKKMQEKMLIENLKNRHHNKSEKPNRLSKKHHSKVLDDESQDELSSSSDEKFSSPNTPNTIQKEGIHKHQTQKKKVSKKSRTRRIASFFNQNHQRQKQQNTITHHNNSTAIIKPTHPAQQDDSNIYVELKRPGYFCRYNKTKIMEKLAQGQFDPSEISSIENAIYSGRMNHPGSMQTGFVEVSTQDQKFFKTSHKLRTGTAIRVEMQKRNATATEYAVYNAENVLSPRAVRNHPKAKK